MSDWTCLTSDLDDFVGRHITDRVMGERTLYVLRRLPEGVCRDFLRDPAFCMTVHDPGRPGGMEVRLGLPRGLGQASRCVALKRSLAGRAAAFAHYVIAHELAHAFLGNGGRWPGEDPELAADALAAEWGFPRPVTG